MCKNAGAFSNQQRGNQIGANQVVLPRGSPWKPGQICSGYPEFALHAIGASIRAGDAD
jgi:hypothetical protein